MSNSNRACSVGAGLALAFLLGWAPVVLADTTAPASAVNVWISVEGQRGVLVERLWKRHSAAARAAGVSEAEFRGVLTGLKPERLVAALAAERFDELTALAKDPSGWALSDAALAKDGSGSGTGSWIGYTSGGNQATGTSSAVAAGANNLASGQNAFVGAGLANQANGLSSLVIGGFDNRADGTDALVGSGAGNRATGARAVIVGGGYNLASGDFSTVGGGGRDGVASTAAGTEDKDQIASGKWSTVGGGTGNEASGKGATVAGGGFNVASGFGSFVGGGGICCSGTDEVAFPNGATNANASVVGGRGNTASGSASIVGGGAFNVASGTSAVVGGGGLNSAGGTESAVGGGRNNGAVGNYSAVVGGEGNGANGTYSVVAGGFSNFAGNSYAAVVGGNDNSATGVASSVLGGASNSASGAYSVAAGRRASVGGTGSFMFADSSDFDYGSVVANEFRVRATGGVVFATAIDGTGVGTESFTISPTGDVFSSGEISAVAFNATSDRHAKRDFLPIDPGAVLDSVLALPIESWSYRGDPGGIRHIGPTAQDFRAAFGVGRDDKSIATVDADGVALAAVQGLNAKLTSALVERDARLAEQAREIVAQRAEIAVLRATQAQEIAELKRAVEVLLARTSPEGRVAAR